MEVEFGKSYGSIDKLLLELIKQDAFFMEVEAYSNPWVPSSSVFLEAFESFRDEIFKIFNNDCFCAHVLQIPGDSNLGAYSFARQEIKYVIFKDTPEPLLIDNKVQFVNASKEINAINWLWDQIDSTIKDNEFSRSMNDWRDQKQKREKIIYCPYFVRKNKEIGLYHQEKGSIKKLYQRMRREENFDNFLSTKTTFLTKDSKKNDLDGAYYASVWIIGVGDSCHVDESEILTMLEAASILFQMSWGYPQLMENRKEDAVREAKYQASQRDNALLKDVLENVQKEIDLAMNIIPSLTTAYFRAREFVNIVTPKPSQLLQLYNDAGTYIPQKDETTGGKQYHDNPKWYFRHAWGLDSIKQQSEAFRAQFSCILLAFKRRDLLNIPENSKWPEELSSPWDLMNKEMPQKIMDLIEKIYHLTLKKIVSKDNVEWDIEDAKAFNFLKSCFHYPFKDAKRLTGPLLMLWATDHKGINSIDEKCFKRLTQHQHLNGHSWPRTELLESIHALFYDIQSCDLQIDIETLDRMRRLNVKIYLLNCNNEYVESMNDIIIGIEEHINNDKLNEYIENRRGGKKDSILKIMQDIEHSGSVKCNIEQSSIEIMFEVSD